MAKNEAIYSEVLIVGGGLVGLTLGIALAQAGLETLVLDRADPSTDLTPDFDGRTSAIAYGSQRILSGLGLWQEMAGEAEPIRSIRVTDGRPGGPGDAGRAAPFFLHYDAADLDGQPMGAHRGKPCAAPNHRPACCGACEPAASGSGRTGRDRVAGTGAGQRPAERRALPARAVGRSGRWAALGPAQGERHRQSGTGTILRSASSPPWVTSATTRAWRTSISCRPGLSPCYPCAMVPCAKGGPAVHRSSLVWTENRAAKERVLALSDCAFAGELRRRFGDSLGRLWVEGPRWVYPLSLTHARHYHRGRLALIGDAAHGIHPIAGQGLNLGIRDIAALAQALVDARRLGLDIGTLRRPGRLRALAALRQHRHGGCH